MLHTYLKTKNDDIIELVVQNNGSTLAHVPRTKINSKLKSMALQTSWQASYHIPKLKTNYK